MLRLHRFMMLALLMMDAGAVAPPSDAAKPDAGIVAPPSDAAKPDAGIVAPQPGSPAGPDGGTVVLQPLITEGIRWPDEVSPLATLDGPAVLAAHAVLQRVLSLFPKKYAGECEFSAKAMEVIVGQEAGLYFVRVNRRVDKCGWAAPGSNFDLDWFELYAVSPDGRILARYPYNP